MKITFLGTGDAFGSGGRFNTCFHVETASTKFLIDCGASSLVAINRAGIDPNEISVIFLSHLHGDHFGGLPFFLMQCQFVTERRMPLVIAGPPGLKARINQLSEAMFPGSSMKLCPFQVDFVEIEPGDTPQTICGVNVQSLEVIHPSGAPATGLRVESGGKLLAYSGDTEWTNTLFQIAAGADLFVCECYAKGKEVPYHLSYETLLAQRSKFQARRIMLTHMSSSMLSALDEIEFETVEDGCVVTL